MGEDLNLWPIKIGTNNFSIIGLKVEMKLIWGFLVGAAFSQMSMDKPETTTASKIQKG